MALLIPNAADAAFSAQAEPDSRDFGDILAAAANMTGVVSGCAVTAQGTPDMTVAVASGTVVVAGTSATVASGNVTITAADGTNPRFDLICVDSAGTKSAVAGTPSSNAVFPDPAGQVVLAAVYVPASDTAINTNQIVDKRVIVKPWVQRSGDTMTGALTIRTAGAGTAMANVNDGGNAAFSGTGYANAATLGFGTTLYQHARGTLAAPLRAKSGDVLGRLAASGARAADDVSAATFPGSGRARLDFIAAEDQTTAANGTYLSYLSCDVGSTTLVERFRIGSGGIWSFFNSASAERVRLSNAGSVWVDDSGLFTEYNAKLAALLVSTNRTATISGNRGGVFSRVTRKGSGLTSDPDIGFYSYMEDAAGLSRVSITGAANNGSGLIRITAAAHGFATGDRVAIGSIVGTTEANNVWTVTNISSSTFDLQGSTFTNAYVSGGIATNAGELYGFFSYVYPTITRGGLAGTANHGDDVNCFVGYNGGTAKGTDAFYLGRNATNFPASSEWVTAFTIDAWADYGIRLNGTYASAGLDTSAGTMTGPAIQTASGHMIQGGAVMWNRVPAGDIVVPANYAMVVPSDFEMPSGNSIELAAGAVMEVL